MAKGAATEKTLGKLHDMLAGIFIKTLQQYEQKMDAVELLDLDELENDVLAALLEKGVEPNPAMLSAISKFLKDNEIMYDTEQLEELSSLERRLKDKREKRGNVISLGNLAVQDEE